MQPETSGRTIGRSVQHFPQVGSTNDLVRAAAQAGEPEGLVVTTDEQIAGRGRRGRYWAAPPGSGLLLSLLLRPTWLPAEAAFSITMLAGVALCEAVEAVVPGLTARLKWPNDLLLPLRDAPNTPLRKAAGILCELATKGAAVEYVIVGIGVNVTQSPTGIVDGRDLSESATHLAAAAGRPIDSDCLRDHLLERLDTRYTALRCGQREALVAAWRARLTSIGQYVTITTHTGPLSGTVVGVDQTGSLLLRTASGDTMQISSGDVSA